MSSDNRIPPGKQPLVQFGDEWLPAHEVWKKMETANVVAAAIERFNKHFPGLASRETREVVDTVRERLQNVEVRMPSRDEAPDIAGIARDLMRTISPEQTIETLKDKYSTELNLNQLIQMAGSDPYREAIARDAAELALNLISPQQTAELWNEARRPAPGGGLWTRRKVEELLDDADAVRD